MAGAFWNILILYVLLLNRRTLSKKLFWSMNVKDSISATNKY